MTDRYDNKDEFMSKRRPTPLPRPIPMNDDVMKGVMVDGFGFAAGPNYVFIDGVVNPPRAEKPTIVTRTLFPTAVIPQIIKGLQEIHKRQQKQKIEVEVIEEKTGE